MVRNDRERHRTYAAHRDDRLPHLKRCAPGAAARSQAIAGRGWRRRRTRRPTGAGLPGRRELKDRLGPRAIRAPSASRCHRRDRYHRASRPTGPTGPAGAPGVSGWNIQTFTAQDPAGQSVSYTATCLNGQHVLGGGVTHAAGTDEFILGTAPSGANSWTASLPDTGSVSHSVTVYAICATTS